MDDNREGLSKNQHILAQTNCSGQKYDTLSACDTWQMIAVHGITGLLLDQWILPVHLASQLVTADGHVGAIEADLEFNFYQSTCLRPLRTRVTNYSWDVTRDYNRG